RRLRRPVSYAGPGARSTSTAGRDPGLDGPHAASHEDAGGRAHAARRGDRLPWVPPAHRALALQGEDLSLPLAFDEGDERGAGEDPQRDALASMASHARHR